MDVQHQQAASQWLIFKDAVEVLNAEGYKIAGGTTENTLRYLWRHRGRLDCGRAFRRLGGRILVNIHELKAWREGTDAAEVRHG